MAYPMLITFGVGIAIRTWLVKTPVETWMSERNEIVTPLTSWKGVTEGLSLYRAGVSPYSGDVFHEMPLMLRFLNHQSKLWGQSIHILFIIIDLITAIVLERIAKHYGKYLLVKQAADVKKISPDATKLILRVENLQVGRLYVIAAYLFNPYTIATCIAKSTAVFNNLALALAILFTLKNNRLKACLCIAVASYISFYPIMLVIPAALFFAKCEVSAGRLKEEHVVYSYVQTSICAASGLIALLQVSYMLEGNWDFLNSTYGFIVNVPDLTPNVGVFWYFFTEMFEHFRPFFICVFQINVFIYSVPLAVRLREHPIFLMYILICVMAIFKSYPSYADTALYLSLLPLWKHDFPYMRNNFVVAVMFVVCSVLAPILWHLWIYAGSANANFYFAITLVYSTAQVFLVTDLLFAFLRREYDLLNGTTPPTLDGKPAQVVLD